MRVLLLCLLIAVAMTTLLAADALRNAAAGMITFASFMVAMVMPTMALSVSAFKPSKRAANSAKQGDAFLIQFQYWAIMLWLAIVLAGLLIAGNVLDWSIWHMDVATPLGKFGFQPIRGLNAAVWFCAALLIAKIGGFIRNYRSLLKLHIDNVLADESAEVQAEHEERLSEIEKQPSDPNFGKVLKDPK